MCLKRFKHSQRAVCVFNQLPLARQTPPESSDDGVPFHTMPDRMRGFQTPHTSLESECLIKIDLISLTLLQPEFCFRSKVAVESDSIPSWNQSRIVRHATRTHG